MKYIYSIIKADYLQRTRSYSFLITLAITVYGAYSFVPPPTASYTTLNIVGYKGVYNSAWVGYVSAMMTTIMLSLYGFFLVNSGIKKDIDTEVGLIIATTPITNFEYLLSKMLSNFLVLLTITGITFSVSIVMFFIRTSGYPFIIANFMLPYLLFAIPALLTISALAVVAEVFLGKRNILQYIIFIFLFGVIMANVTNARNNTVAVFIDPFGVRTMTHSITDKVNAQFHESVPAVNLGFTFNAKHAFKTFVWDGISWSGIFFLSRLVWICFAFGIVYISSFFFHRFDFKQSISKKKKGSIFAGAPEMSVSPAKSINIALLPPVITDYSIFPFVKTEILLLIRKGSKWFWLINGALWLSMFFAPLNITHAYLLPVLLFLQVTRWSDLATKEKTNRLHYFTFSSYKPLQRMLPAQLLAGIIMALALTLPVLVRYIFASDIYHVITIINGGIFVVMLAVCLGILSDGKKLYEIMFFMLTYCIVEKIPIADYLGAMQHDSRTGFIITMLLFNLFFGAVSFTVRGYQVRHL
ncbi:hypothetical protein [Mucilaginibacter xinganensis]|uniref:Uncharacterized protein n=1 Tax=Mucilaginibacter xinganensis TaxID=1234841 RepID=A0A223P3Q6_9SPHI|nr:hypothetical protein [Mucilaginibacter xinganensis]ASU36604.1 hypothetical protein MuYL_4721 [Mucilaginibacter xinganensis]